MRARKRSIRGGHHLSKIYDDAVAIRTYRNALGVIFYALSYRCAQLDVSMRAPIA